MLCAPNMYAITERSQDQSGNFILGFDVFHVFIRTPTCSSGLRVGELIQIYSLSHTLPRNALSYILIGNK